jgi:hypothetical protein
MTKSHSAAFTLRVFTILCVLKTTALIAVDDIPGSSSGGPLERRFAYFPRYIPEAPPDDTIDPEEIARLIEAEAKGSICSKMTSLLEDHVNPLPIVDWLNASSLPSFFEPTVRSLLKREEYYNGFDSLGRYSLGVRPYGFYSNFKLHEDTFKLATFGVTVDGAVTVYDRWVIGGGLGYWHSNLDWGKKSDRNSVNTIYGGPFGGYLFDQAYIGLTLLGIYNMYKVNSLFIKGHDKSHEGWDIGARLEGAYEYEWTRYFGNNFFIQPNGDLSYLWVSQRKMDETTKLPSGKEFAVSVGSRTYNFMRYRLGVTFKKEFYQVERGILIPSLSIAWVFMQPLSSSHVKLTCGDSSPSTVKHKKYPSSNQLYLGAKVVAINTRAFLISLGADIFIAKLYPIYAGNLRFEWNW